MESSTSSQLSEADDEKRADTGRWGPAKNPMPSVAAAMLQGQTLPLVATPQGQELPLPAALQEPVAEGQNLPPPAVVPQEISPPSLLEQFRLATDLPLPVEQLTPESSQTQLATDQPLPVDQLSSQLATNQPLPVEQLTPVSSQLATDQPLPTDPPTSKKRVLRSPAFGPTVKQYCLMFQGNNSQKWDGKEIIVETDWLESLYKPEDLQEGKTVSLPYPMKGGEMQLWQAVITSTEGTSKMAKVKNTPKKGRSSVKKAVQKGKAAQKGSPKKKQKGKDRAQGSIISVGEDMLTESPSTADQSPIPTKRQSKPQKSQSSTGDPVLSQLVKQQGEMIGLLTTLVQNIPAVQPSPLNVQPPPQNLDPSLTSFQKFNSSNTLLPSEHFNSPTITQPPLQNVQSPQNTQPPLQKFNPPQQPLQSPPNSRPPPQKFNRLSTTPLLSQNFNSPPITQQPLQNTQSPPNSWLPPQKCNHSPLPSQNFNTPPTTVQNIHSSQGTPQNLNRPSMFRSSSQHFSHTQSLSQDIQPSLNMQSHQQNALDNQNVQLTNNSGSSQYHAVSAGTDPYSEQASSQDTEQLEVFEVINSFNADSFSDELTGEDSDYMTWGDSDFPQDSWITERSRRAEETGGGSQSVETYISPPPRVRRKNFSESERTLSTSSSTSSLLYDHDSFMSPPRLASTVSSRESSSSRSSSVVSPSPQLHTGGNIPPPPFRTPPKLQSIEQVMSNYTGTDVASLRVLATALARDAIFGREEMSSSSLSGRKGTGVLNQEKLNYIKTLVKTRVPGKPAVEFEHIWTLCKVMSSYTTWCEKEALNFELTFFGSFEL